MTGSDKWQFSNAPVDSDVVNDLKTASIYRYNGTSNSWGKIWDPLDDNDNDKGDLALDDVFILLLRCQCKSGRRHDHASWQMARLS